MFLGASRLIVLDACCLLNLCAARESPSLLDALGCEILVPDQVLGETLFLRQVDPDNPEKLKEIPLDPRHRIQSGHVKSCSLAGNEELDLFVRMAVQLADGEAACIAIAKARNAMAATDDRKARRLAGELGVGAIGTPELMKAWADNTKADRHAIKAALGNIQRFARYVPRPDLPESGWWHSSLA